MKVLFFIFPILLFYFVPLKREESKDLSVSLEVVKSDSICITVKNVSTKK